MKHYALIMYLSFVNYLLGNTNFRSNDEIGSRGIEAQRLKEEIKSLDKYEQSLDELITSIENALKLAKEDPTDRVYRYI